MENFVNEVTTCFFGVKFVYNNIIQYDQNLLKDNERVVLNLYVYSSHNSPTMRCKSHFTSETHFFHSEDHVELIFFSSEIKLQEQYSNFFFYLDS